MLQKAKILFSKNAKRVYLAFEDTNTECKNTSKEKINIECNEC